MTSLYRQRLLATTLLVGTGLLATPAMAQDAAADAQVATTQDTTVASADGTTNEDEGIVVTGSRIVRPNLESSTPVVSVTADQIEAQGSENLADVAQTIPSFAPNFGGGRTTSSFSGTAAFGLNSANLRNLGGGRSVVLINGRRVPGGTSTGTTVDFNTLPTANIERLDVITGGASAVYGADAVSGVVNIITKKRFTGLELGASYGIAEEGYNKNPNLYALVGGNFGDGGHALLTAQYVYEGIVRCRDVYICNTDIRYNNPLEGPVRAPGTGITGIAPLSGVIPTGNFFIGGAQFTRDPATGALIPFSGSVASQINTLGYNRNPERTLAIPTQRILLAAEVDYPIFDNVTAFLEMNYGNAKTEGPIEPIAFQTAVQTFGTGPNAVQVTLPTTNPFFIAATTPAQRATLTASEIANGISFGIRMPDPRGSTNTRQTFRTAVGLRGDYSLLGNDWNWEGYYVFGRTETNLVTEGLYGTDRLFNALRVEPVPGQPGQFRCVDAGARATGCVPFNPFQSLTEQQAARNYLRLSAGQGGVSELNNAVAFTSGELFQLPYGGLSVALGAEYRTFRGGQDIDAPIQAGTTTSNQLNPTPYVTTKTKEVFGEIVVPLLKDVPFADVLELEGAARYTDSNRSKNYWTYKYGGSYAPFDGLRFRAIRAKAVRAPTPGELGGGGTSFGNVNDPCVDTPGSVRQTNPTVNANCLADGVPAGYNPPLGVLQGVAGATGGNPALQPEVAKTLTFGAIFTPRFVPGLAISVDRFAIDIDGFVSTVGRANKLNLCYTTTARQFCGDIVRGFRPEINANYAIVAVNDQLVNANNFELRGTDVEINYTRGVRFGLFNNERISAQVLGTYYDRAEQTETTGAITRLDGFAGGDTSTQGYIRWQANTNLRYASDFLNFNYNLRYIPKTETGVITSQYPLVPAESYHNVRLGINPFRNFEVYGGINNLTDNRPPILPDQATGSQAQNTISGFYDVFGRSYYVGTRIRF